MSKILSIQKRSDKAIKNETIDPDTGLTTIQERALYLLLSSTDTKEEIAKKCNIARVTLYRWINQDVNFSTELKRRKTELWNESKDDILIGYTQSIKALKKNAIKGDFKAQELFVKFVLNMLPKGNKELAISLLGDSVDNSNMTQRKKLENTKEIYSNALRDFMDTDREGFFKYQDEHEKKEIEEINRIGCFHSRYHLICECKSCKDYMKENPDCACRDCKPLIDNGIVTYNKYLALRSKNRWIFDLYHNYFGTTYYRKEPYMEGITENSEYLKILEMFENGQGSELIDHEYLKILEQEKRPPYISKVD